MAIYGFGVVICLLIAALGGKLFLWATKLNARVKELEAQERPTVFLGASQEELDVLKKAVGVNATTFVGNLKIHTNDIAFLKAKTKELEQGLFSVANEVADMKSEPTKQVATPSGQPRARGLPFAT